MRYLLKKYGSRWLTLDTSKMSTTEILDV